VTSDLGFRQPSGVTISGIETPFLSVSTASPT
jgi:hypothetical protein